MKWSKMLVWLAVLAFCAAWWSVFFVLWVWAALLVLSMVLATVAELLDRVRGNDCGYPQTPFGHGPHPSAAAVVAINSRRPVWPNEAGAPE